MKAAVWALLALTATAALPVRASAAAQLRLLYGSSIVAEVEPCG